ncbi:GMC oxidoreductase, partial [Nocardia salmonicida]|uniref:GMC oxidoreductase n=1 Tax=Nocardia salmonicida TaxID=53431 RepID=UPI003659F84E
ITIVHVASRGRLRLRSSDPAWKPEMDPGYFSDPIDLRATIAGARRVIEISQASAIGKYLDRPFMPNRIAGVTDDDLADHIRATAQTLYHPVSTCAMGSGEQSVVDTALRVNGFDGLRVVDASVMPAITRGNTNAPTIMIAEKAADLILGRTAPNRHSEEK